MKTVIFTILGICSYCSVFAQDTQGPVMTSFMFTPSSVDVSTSPANITFNANITDNLSGVNSVLITIQLPNGSFQSEYASLSMGTSLDGTWTRIFVIPQLSMAGTGNLIQMVLFDVANNPRFYSSANFPGLGIPTFTVINSNPPDNAAPQLISFSINPSSVDVSSSAQIITITARLTDNLSGVRNVTANIQLPNGSTLNSLGTLPLPLTALDGMWEMQFTIPRYTLPGIANLTSLNAVDTSGNQITYTAMSMPAIGTFGTTGFNIINSNPDNSAPSLTSFTVTPSSVNITLAAQNIIVRATATDNLAGVKSASVTIRLPNNTFQSTNAVYDITSSSTLNGQWDAMFTIPFQTSPGTGVIFQLTLLDSANINRVYSLNDLTLLGPNFTVINESVLPVQWLRPVTALIHNHYSFVEWSTASEINNEKFVIEHSTNGKEFYYTGELKGNGNTSDTKTYSFMHESPSAGINYYRIKQMDFDGKFSYSNIASVSYKVSDLIIYPNPFLYDILIETSFGTNLQILDLNGKVIKTQQLLTGKNEVSLTSLSSGLYLLVLQNGERYKIIKE